MSCSFKHKTKAFSRRRSHRQEGKKWKKVHTPPPRTKFVLFWLKNKSLLQNENNSGPSNLLFFFSFASKCPSESDWCARPGSNERAFFTTGKEKNRFCSYLGKVLPFIFAVAMIICIFGRYKCYAVCLCDWEGTREFAERREKRAQSAQIERDGNTLREGNKPPLPPSNSPKTTLLDFCSSRK